MFLSFNAGNTISHFLSLLFGFFKNLFLLLRETYFRDFDGRTISYSAVIFGAILITALCSYFYKGGRG